MGVGVGVGLLQREPPPEIDSYHSYSYTYSYSYLSASLPQRSTRESRVRCCSLERLVLGCQLDSQGANAALARKAPLICTLCSLSCRGEVCSQRTDLIF